MVPSPGDGPYNRPVIIPFELDENQSLNSSKQTLLNSNGLTQHLASRCSATRWYRCINILLICILIVVCVYPLIHRASIDETQVISEDMKLKERLQKSHGIHAYTEAFYLSPRSYQLFSDCVHNELDGRYSQRLILLTLHGMSYPPAEHQVLDTTRQKCLSGVDATPMFDAHTMFIMADVMFKHDISVFIKFIHAHAGVLRTLLRQKVQLIVEELLSKFTTLPTKEITRDQFDSLIKIPGFLDAVRAILGPVVSLKSNDIITATWIYHKIEIGDDQLLNIGCDHNFDKITEDDLYKILFTDELNDLQPVISLSSQSYGLQEYMDFITTAVAVIEGGYTPHSINDHDPLHS